MFMERLLLMGIPISEVFLEFTLIHPFWIAIDQNVVVGLRELFFCEYPVDKNFFVFVFVLLKP